MLIEVVTVGERLDSILAVWCLLMYRYDVDNVDDKESASCQNIETFVLLCESSYKITVTNWRSYFNCRKLIISNSCCSHLFHICNINVAVVITKELSMTTRRTVHVLVQYISAADCPTGMVYSENAPACPATCSGTDEGCEGSAGDGCVCPDGKVMHQGSCIKQQDCVCREMDGDVYQVKQYLYNIKD